MNNRTLLAFVVLLVVLTGCGNGMLTVSGSLGDPLISDSRSCNVNGKQEVELTNAAGTVIARDNALFTWLDKRCVIPFSFSDVPHLAGYGIRVASGNGSTHWLTPAQVSKPVTISEMPLV